MADGRSRMARPIWCWPPRRFEHVPEPTAFLEHAFRALRPGGTVIITTPFAARWHYIPHDYWRFTPSSLRLLLERAGFEDVVVYGRGNESTVACYKVQLKTFSFYQRSRSTHCCTL